MRNILHPNNGVVSIEELESRLAALERVDNRFAQRGGGAVSYDANGRIESLVATYIIGQVVNAQIANIDFAKITGVSITNAMITSLDAGKITTGTLDADRIGANSITAGKMNVSSLSAISADLGTITAGSITGATIKTSSSGQRVELTSSDYISLYNSSNAEVGRVYAVGGDLYLDSFFDVIINGDFISLAGAVTDLTALGMQGDIVMNDNLIDSCEMIKFTENTSAPDSGDGIWYYKNGGSYEFRSRMEGGNWAFDQSAA